MKLFTLLIALAPVSAAIWLTLIVQRRALLMLCFVAVVAGCCAWRGGRK